MSAKRSLRNRIQLLKLDYRRARKTARRASAPFQTPMHVLSACRLEAQRSSPEWERATFQEGDGGAPVAGDEVKEVIEPRVFRLSKEDERPAFKGRVSGKR
ncbi:importin subunit, putative [Pseudozyma hubeiensis SY62]|uniref:Importin subunit, putative n=1 Tax=Pseudozyma hubeiensis (strain SY62) TaxID=1305764 RepID=R9P6E7_PSEHS|nr:importin subunit, putative [Pseudozyma hubeiensis SY62]GAC93680.1 importin subunit, putative [Pseudozyma hubeiensis SY62]